MSALGLPQMKH